MGYIMGGLIFNSNFITNIYNRNMYYFLEEESQDTTIHNYIAITKSLGLAKKIKGTLTTQGYSILIRKRYLNNKEFQSNITMFDNLINSDTTDEEILKIEELVLKNYEEIVKNNSNN